MKIKRGLIPIIVVVLVAITYEVVATFVINWTGLYRIILAGLLWPAAYSIGKNIENKILGTTNEETSNKTLNIIVFAGLFVIIIGINVLYGLNAKFQNSNSKNIELVSDNIENTLTKEHVYIPTTKVNIIPPKGFVFNEYLQRFQKNERTYIQIAEMPGVDFRKNEFSKGNFEAKGAKIFYWKELKVNGLSAKLCILQGDMTTKNILFAFGDESFSAMIIGYCSMKDTLSASEIQKSILSIFYDSSKIVDPLEIARFEIDLLDTDYQFYRYASNTYMYAKEGKEDNNPLQTHFMVLQVPSVGNDDYALINYANSLIKNFEESGVPPITIVKSESININGFRGYLIIGETIFQSNPISIYELVITNEETTATLTGYASENIEREMKMFERIGKTFKIKNH